MDPAAAGVATLGPRGPSAAHRNPVTLRFAGRRAFSSKPGKSVSGLLRGRAPARQKQDPVAAAPARDEQIGRDRVEIESRDPLDPGNEVPGPAYLILVGRWQPRRRIG